MIERVYLLNCCVAVLLSCTALLAGGGDSRFRRQEHGSFGIVLEKKHICSPRHTKRMRATSSTTTRVRRCHNVCVKHKHCICIVLCRLLYLPHDTHTHTLAMAVHHARDVCVCVQTKFIGTLTLTQRWRQNNTKNACVGICRASNS